MDFKAVGGETPSIIISIINIPTAKLIIIPPKREFE